MNEFSDLSIGGSKNTSFDITLNIIGLETDYDVEATVYRLSKNNVLVVSRNQVIIDASDYDMLAGLEKLREIAGLTSIEPVVPVSFALSFKK